MKSQQGFSLIEIMIVLLIIGTLVTLVTPSISNQGREAKGAVRKFGLLTRTLFSNARLFNKTYRLVIDLKEEDSEEAQQYWVESTTKKVLFESDPEKRRQAAEDRKEAEEQARRDGEPLPPEGGFEADTRVFKEKQTLKSGLRFKDIEIPGEEDPFTEGLVYIHFYPHGLAQEAVFHLILTEKAQWTLAIQPLTGKTDLVARYVAYKNLRRE